jgi:hypothetical protein
MQQCGLRLQVSGRIEDTKMDTDPTEGHHVVEESDEEAKLGWLLLHPSPDATEPAQHYALDGTTVTIGRAPTCRVALPEDNAASRLHAIVRFEESHYVISDLGSSNGTLVNGLRIKDATPLDDGDRISVGEHVLHFTRSAPRDADAESTHMDPIELPQTPDAVTLLDPATPSGALAPQADDTRDATGDPSELTDVQFAPAHPEPDVTSRLLPPAQIAPATGELTQLRHQLIESSSVLAQWAETTTHHTKQLVSRLAAMAENVAVTLAAVEDAVSSQTREELIRTVDSVAQDPHHVNTLFQLSGHTSAIAQSLRTQQQLVDALKQVGDQLAALARHEGW